VTLFAAGFPSSDSVSQVSGFRFQILPCLRRGDRMARFLSRAAPQWTWRWGLKNPYGWEQLSFWLGLRRALREGEYDILHVQDPMLAYWCKRARERGQLVTQEILAHGTEEPIEFVAQFPCVQHLAPWHLRKAEEALTKTQRSQREEYLCLCESHLLCMKNWVAIPNFVNTDLFAPAQGDEMRRRLGIPLSAKVVLCVAAIKKDHKRIDYLINEAASAARDDMWLVVAGAATGDTPELKELARQRLGNRAVFVTDLPHSEMHTVYPAADLFTLVSLKEMMPIALLEAMACGLPCLVSNHPVQRWMIGEVSSEFGVQSSESPLKEDVSVENKGQKGHSPTVREKGSVGCHTANYELGTLNSVAAAGESIDMSMPRALAGAILRNLENPDLMRRRSEVARDRAVRVFSREAVIGQYIGYYHRVLRGWRPSPGKKK
jgi:glycosyltransferase involved in cell wall biosynthesis